MYYCCGITDKGVMKHNEDAFMIGKKVMSSGSVDFMSLLHSNALNF